MNAEGVNGRLHPLVGRLLSIAAGWKLRALEMEKCKAALSAQFLRECADEVEAAFEGRDAKRTSWFKHEDEIERLRGLEVAVSELMEVAGPVMWQDSRYFRAADRCAQLLTPNASLTGGASAPSELKR